MMRWYGPRVGYLCVMSANWSGASERAVGVALLRVGVGVVLDLVVPGLDVEGWGLVPKTQHQVRDDSAVCTHPRPLTSIAISLV